MSAPLKIEFPEKLHFLFEPARYKILHGGRGGAKSWGVARALLIQGVQQPLRVLCAREFQNSIAESVHKLLADQTKTLGLTSHYEIQKSAIYGRNGSEFTFAGLRRNVTSIKSYEGADRVWIEEGQTVSKASWDILTPTIRKPGSEIWCTFNPYLEEDETYQRFIVAPPPDARVVQINWSDNPWFPPELRAEKDHLRSRDMEAYLNVWEGQPARRVVGALWTMDLLNNTREPEPADEDARRCLVNRQQRIVVAVDPSGCSGTDDKRSDEVGIVVAALGQDGIGRVLEDASGRYSPDGWAQKTIEMFRRWACDLIVGESNYGGAMVEHTIRTAWRNAPVKLVTASRGKVQRAEPVAALYQQGRILHVGYHSALERQMCLFSSAGYQGPRSPDRADGAIWAFTELMVEMSSAPQYIEHYEPVTISPF